MLDMIKVKFLTHKNALSSVSLNAADDSVYMTDIQTKLNTKLYLSKVHILTLMAPKLV